MLVADFHSHLARNEIIGFLAGSWDAEENVIHVHRAFPCRALDIGDSRLVNVEMDPTSAIEVRDAIQRAGSKVVGWYHSHPAFQPDPSLRDIENQQHYQSLFRDEACSKEPFVGLIVATYDTDLPNAVSIVNTFIANTTNLTVAEANGQVALQRRVQSKRSSRAPTTPSPMFISSELVGQEKEDVSTEYDSFYLCS